MTALVEVEDLRGGYPGRPVLEDVTFSVPAGARVAVLGPNGGGKTTLFRALLGQLPECEGRASLAAPVAYVPQTERARLDFPVTAHDVVLMGAYGSVPWWRRIGARDRDRARAALARLGLAEEERTLFGDLSGGQRQRVALARALMQDAGILLLDEPLSGVDRTSAARIEGLFEALRDEGRVLLVATHDVAQARRFDRVLCLNGRQVAFGEPAETLTAEVLRATYGAEIIDLGEGGLAVAVDHHEHGHSH